MTSCRHDQPFQDWLALHTAWCSESLHINLQQAGTSDIFLGKIRISNATVGDFACQIHYFLQLKFENLLIAFQISS